MNHTVVGPAKDLNGRKLADIPPTIKRAVEQGDPIYIFNIYKHAYNVSLGSLGSYFIPACKAGEPYSKPLVIPAMVVEQYDIGEGRMGYATWEGRDVAANVLGGRINTNGDYLGGENNTDKTAWGCFMTTNAVPTDAELATAKAKLAQKMADLVQQGDLINMGNDAERKTLDRIHREAAQYLNISRDWAALPTSTGNCGACGSSIKPGIAVCPVCSAVVDEEKARKFFPERFTHAAPQIAPQKNTPSAK